MSRATLTDLANLGLPAALLNALPGGTTQQQAALDAASAMVDSYLASNYTLPLASYGHDIIEAEVNLASWQLLTARGFNPEVGIDQGVKARYDTTLEWLKAIARGEIFPNVTETTPSPTGGQFVNSQPSRGWTGGPRYTGGTRYLDFWDPYSR